VIKLQETLAINDEDHAAAISFRSAMLILRRRDAGAVLGNRTFSRQRYFWNAGFRVGLDSHQGALQIPITYWVVPSQ
jgi:hypothetical protein